MRHARRSRNASHALVLAAICLLSWTNAAFAQPVGAPTPQDVQAASAAFAEGQRAQLRGDHARAAELFELANASAPSAAALRSAVRNRRAAGHAAQAATGALEALALYANDGATVQLANDVIAELSPRLARVTLECAPDCSATLDGRVLAVRAVARRELFVDPGSHVIRAEWPGHPPVEQTVAGVAGQPLAVRLDRPAAPVEPPAPVEPQPLVGRGLAPRQPDPPPPPPPAPPPPPSRAGLSPLFFWAGTGLTAVAVGLSVWSGLDTLSARDDYEAAPTRSGYEDGVDLEVRTNALLVTSAVLGAATVALGLLSTDWGGAEVEPVVGLGPDGALLGLRTEL